MKVTEQVAIEFIKNEKSKFYNSRIWRNKSKSILKRDRYECQDCKNQKKYKRASEVHHILSIDTHPELAFTNTNLVSLCKTHHNLRENREKNLRQHKPKFSTPERW